MTSSWTLLSLAESPAVLMLNPSYHMWRKRWPHDNSRLASWQLSAYDSSFPYLLIISFSDASETWSLEASDENDQIIINIVNLDTEANWDIVKVFDGNFIVNKANLRDLVAATGLLILLKLDSNHRFYDLEIWWMTSENYRAPFLCHVKLCA